MFMTRFNLLYKHAVAKFQVQVIQLEGVEMIVIRKETKYITKNEIIQSSFFSSLYFTCRV